MFARRSIGVLYCVAREIFAVAGLPVTVEAAAPGGFRAKVPRPAYSVLENAALKAQGINRFGAWQEGLRKYLFDGMANA